MAPTSFLAQEAVGGLSAGIVGTVLGYPLDTIKARQQILGRQRGNAGILGTAQSIVRHEGPTGLYRGLVPPLISLSVLNTMNFTLYSYVQQQFKGRRRSRSSSTPSSSWHHGFQIDNAVAGASVGMLASTVSTIENFVKTQLQIDNTRAQPRYKGSRDCVQQIMRGGVARGIQTLYTGHVVNTLREMAFLATYFGLYEGFRELLVASHGPADKNHSTSRRGAWSIPLAGGMAGAAAWAVSFPLDCVRAGVQGQDVWERSHSSGTNNKLALSAPDVFRNLIRRRGWWGLYSGVTPSIVRAFIVSGSRFTAYEAALWFLRGGRDHGVL